MDYELTLYQLGNFLENILEKYKMTLTIKVKLSGGWITLRSNVKIDSLPKEEGLTAGNNVISLKLDNAGYSISLIKLLLPLPLTPVITVNKPFGIFTDIFLRLFWAAPVSSI